MSEATEESIVSQPRQFLAWWAKQRIPNYYLLKILALTAYFQNNWELAYICIDTLHQTNQTGSSVHLPSEIQPLPQEAEALKTFDIALGAALAYTAKRYSVYYPHSLAPPALPGYNGMPLEPDDPNYVSVPHFHSRKPGDDWELHQGEIDTVTRNTHRAPTKQEEFTVRDLLPIPRFVDFRELAPSYAWAEAVSTTVRQGSKYFLEVDESTQSERLTDSFSGRLIQFLRLASIGTDYHLPEFQFARGMPTDSVRETLDSLNQFWDHVFIAWLPHPDFFIGMIERWDDKHFIIDSKQRLDSTLLGKVYDAGGRCVIEGAVPDHFKRWIRFSDKGPTLPAPAITSIQCQAQKQEAEWLRSHSRSRQQV